MKEYGLQLIVSARKERNMIHAVAHLEIWHLEWIMFYCLSFLYDKIIFKNIDVQLLIIAILVNIHFGNKQETIYFNFEDVTQNKQNVLCVNQNLCFLNKTMSPFVLFGHFNF